MTWHFCQPPSNSELRLVTYKGSAKITYANDEQEAVFEGSFETEQCESGRIATRFVVSPSASEFRIPVGLAQNFTISFSGSDSHGWDLTTLGEFLSAPPPFNLLSNRSEYDLCPLHLVARFKDTPVGEYDKARFCVSTLLWHQGDGHEPDPLELEVRGFRVLIEPVDNYLNVVARIMNGGGVEPTASVFVQSVDDKKLPFQCYTDFMDDLIYVFRLATGAGVEWYYGEALETGSEAPKERLHKYATHGPFSSALRTLVPNPDFSGLAEAFLDDSERDLDWDVAKGLINAYVNACNDELPLEQRGLLASTLIDLLVALYAETKGGGDIIPENEFEEVYATLKDAIDNTDLCAEWKQHVANSLKGVYRRTFSQRLKLLVQGLQLPLNSNKRYRIVTVRNELVHRVTYPSEYENWYNNYMLMIWMGYISLCGLLGYKGEFPILHQDWKLGG